MSLRVNSVTSGICGSGKYIGYPVTYVVLQMGKEKYSRKSIETVVKDVRMFRNHYVRIEGGEPLLQDELMPLVYELSDLGYIVSVETSGGVFIIDDRTIRTFSYVVNVKTPSIGEINPKCNVFENVGRLCSKDEVIFRVTNESDYVFAKDFLKQNPTKADIIMIPVEVESNPTILKDLSTWVHDDKLSRTRLEVQYHQIDK